MQKFKVVANGPGGNSYEVTSDLRLVEYGCGSVYSLYGPASQLADEVGERFKGALGVSVVPFHE